MSSISLKIPIFHSMDILFIHQGLKTLSDENKVMHLKPEFSNFKLKKGKNDEANYFFSSSFVLESPQ
jgi:hypothetical protein